MLSITVLTFSHAPLTFSCSGEAVSSQGLPMRHHFQQPIRAIHSYYSPPPAIVPYPSTMALSFMPRIFLGRYTPLSAPASSILSISRICKTFLHSFTINIISIISAQHSNLSFIKLCMAKYFISQKFVDMI